MTMPLRVCFAIIFGCLLSRTGMAAELVVMPVAFSDVEVLAANAPAAEYRYGDAPSQFARLWLPDSSSRWLLAQKL